MSDLKPCPFCGSENLKLTGTGSSIYCEACECCGPRQIGSGYPDDSWNRRASPWRDTAEELPAELETCWDEDGERCYFSDGKWWDLETHAEYLNPPKQWAYISDLLPEEQ